MARKEREPGDPSAVGALLRRLRRNRDISVTAMAHKIGLSTSYISGIENGHDPVSERVLLGYVDVLDLDKEKVTQAIEAIRRASPGRPRFGFGLALRGPVTSGTHINEVDAILATLRQQFADLGLALEQTQALVTLLIDSDAERGT